MYFMRGSFVAGGDEECTADCTAETCAPLLATSGGCCGSGCPVADETGDETGADTDETGAIDEILPEPVSRRSRLRSDRISDACW
jgi:hypothetical protein